MTVREFMSQALYMDKRINCKICQLDALNDLATKCTSVITGMPHSPSGSVSKLEDVVVKIIDLQDEVNREIDALVELKIEIMQVIREVSNPEHQMVLEQRYLCCMDWEAIAEGLGYCTRQVKRLHSEALKSIKFKKDVTKCH